MRMSHGPFKGDFCAVPVARIQERYWSLVIIIISPNRRFKSLQIWIEEATPLSTFPAK